MHFHAKLRLFSASIVLIQSSYSFGWGANGHKIIGLIAEKNLTAKARKKVDEILAEDEVKLTVSAAKHPLAEISTWADTIKKKEEGKGTGPWHFTDMDSDDTKSAANLKKYCGENESCSLLRAKSFLAELSSSDFKNVDKARALRFYDHLVGDIHQPLHNIGWKDENGVSDAGGNLRAVFFFDDKDPFYGNRRGILNLHGVWDTNIITHMMQARDMLAPAQDNFLLDSQVVDNFEGLSSTKLERFADEVAKVLKTSSPPPSLDPIDWGWEAHQYARSHAYGESLKPMNIFKTLLENKLLSWSDSQTEDDNRTNLTPAKDSLAAKDFDSKYYNACAKVVEKQLAFAGLRLAQTLNEAFK